MTGARGHRRRGRAREHRRGLHSSGLPPPSPSLFSPILSLSSLSLSPSLPLSLSLSRSLSRLHSSGLPLWRNVGRAARRCPPPPAPPSLCFPLSLAAQRRRPPRVQRPAREQARPAAARGQRRAAISNRAALPRYGPARRHRESRPTFTGGPVAPCPEQRWVRPAPAETGGGPGGAVFAETRGSIALPVGLGAEHRDARPRPARPGLARPGPVPQPTDDSLGPRG